MYNQNSLTWNDQSFDFSFVLIFWQHFYFKILARYRYSLFFFFTIVDALTAFDNNVVADDGDDIILFYLSLYICFIDECKTFDD